MLKHVAPALAGAKYCPSIFSLYELLLRSQPTVLAQAIVAKPLLWNFLPCVKPWGSSGLFWPLPHSSFLHPYDIIYGVVVELLTCSGLLVIRTDNFLLIAVINELLIWSWIWVLENRAVDSFIAGFWKTRTWNFEMARALSSLYNERLVFKGCLCNAVD